MPIANVRTAEDNFARELATPTQRTILLGAFAVLALLLASIGLYGVLSYAVTQRTNEIGVRMALGATPGKVRRQVVSQGTKVVLIGVAIGVTVAHASTRFLGALLY